MRRRIGLRAGRKVSEGGHGERGKGGRVTWSRQSCSCVRRSAIVMLLMFGKGKWPSSGIGMGRNLWSCGVKVVGGGKEVWAFLRRSQLRTRPYIIIISESLSSSKREASMIRPRIRSISSIANKSVSTCSSTTTPPHNSLASFLAHARTTALSPTSTVYTGTYYEYLCLQTLSRLGFTLTRTGGRSDHGIDLLGHWTLPSLPVPLRALVQCKALKAKSSPETVRELEGIFAGAPVGWRGDSVVGVLCAKREATKGVREAVRRSTVPALWVMLEDVGEGHGRVRQVLWNRRVSELGAEGVGVGLRYLPREGAEGVEKEVVLTWKGEVWEPERSDMVDA